MKSKAIGVIIAFTTLATVLNFIRIPVPFLPTFNYQMGDIILVIAFLLFGIGTGLVVALLNMIITMAIFPSITGFIGAPYYLVSILTMILGIYFFERILKRKVKNNQYIVAKSATLSTVTGILTRISIMLPLDYFAYGFLVSLVSGWSISDAYALVLYTMPLIILYNITVPIYVIPISYYTAKKVTKHFDSALFENSLI